VGCAGIWRLRNGAAVAVHRMSFSMMPMLGVVYPKSAIRRGGEPGFAGSDQQFAPENLPGQVCLSASKAYHSPPVAIDKDVLGLVPRSSDIGSV